VENGLSTLKSVRWYQSWAHGPVVTEGSRAGSLCATDPQWPRVILSAVGSLRTRHARVLPKIGLGAASFLGSEPSSLPRYAR
jgi:hypothetical protein